MNEDQKISDLLPAITAQVNESFRHEKNSSQKGWGQFLHKNEHEHQIGLYGTCAALMVRSLNNPATECEQGVIEFLESRKLRPKDFNQNARLAFLIWALSFSSHPPLVLLKEKWLSELLNRQRGDGGWGDSKPLDEENVVSRPEVTALALFALAANLDHAREHANRAVEFLTKFINSRPSAITQIDPFVIAAALDASHKIGTANQRVVRSAVKLLRSGLLNSDLRIFFFDYFQADETESTTKRDFLCIPNFFSFCCIACSPALKGFSPKNFFTVSLSRRNATAWLTEQISDGTIAPPASSHYSTMDQAFAALSVRLLSDNPPQFQDQVWILSRILNRIQKPTFTKTLFSCILLALILSLATNPDLITDVLKSSSSDWSKRVISLITDWKSWIQIGSLLLSAILGQTLLKIIYTYFKRLIGL